MKRFAVWLSYGSYGPREGFPNLYDYYTPSESQTTPTTTSSEPSKSSHPEVEKTQMGNILSQLTSQGQAPKPMKKELKDAKPIDLPFTTPSILQTLSPKPTTKIHKLPARDPRAFGKIRVTQYQQDRRMNPYNRIVLLVLVLLTILNFKKDRRVNNTGVVPEYPWEVAAKEEKKRVEQEELEKKLKEEEEKVKLEQEKAEEKKKNARKWYYLWLK
ncbi:unnamed protein product [Ambrosiozyma monospora]|uniref:Unnamed protein product n=1 Tax=Ambrosiozyma monospora TaxID=43982 RepID=A0ACB5TPR4_AMBMO|nr:unnamed protein product [Ambrosiozyma monospora]